MLENPHETLLEYIPGTVTIDDGKGLKIRASLDNIYPIQEWLDIEFPGCMRLVDGEWQPYDQRSYLLFLEQIADRRQKGAHYIVTLEDGTVLTFEQAENTDALDRTEVLYPQSAAE